MVEKSGVEKSGVEMSCNLRHWCNPEAYGLRSTIEIDMNAGLKHIDQIFMIINTGGKFE